MFGTVFRKLGTNGNATVKKSGAYEISRSGPRLTYNDPTNTTISAKHHFERLSDTELQLRHSNNSDVELEETGIRVRKQVAATVVPGAML